MLAIANIEQGRRQLLVEPVACAYLDFVTCEDVTDGRDYLVYKQDLTMLNDEIPYRFQERVFSRVAAHIGLALKRYPNITPIRTHLAATTLSRLIQEAIKAKTLYAHTHPDIDESLWRSFGAELGTSVADSHTVLIGPRSALKQGATPVLGTLREIEQPEYEVAGDYDALRFVSQLLHMKAISPVPRFVTHNLPSEQQSFLESTYDVAITPDPSNPSKFYIT